MRSKSGSITAQALRRLTRNDRGTVLPYFAVLTAALVGFAGLSVDVGRLVTTNTQAKSAADAAALAGATMLASAIRAPGADPNNPQPVIDAVRQAAQQGVSNRQTFATVGTGSTATTGGTVRIASIRLLTSLPELNGGSASASVDAYVTSDPWKAKFIEVTTDTMNQQNAFLPVVGTERTSGTRATAIAGYTQVVCNVPPLWICNPADTGGTSSGIFVPEDWRGKEARLKASGPGSAWAPGNFGLLDSPNGTGANAVAQMMATVAPNTCFKSEGANLRPGQASSVRTALNTRFDIYENPYFGSNADKSNPNYRPARNVIKGMKWDNNNCNGFTNVGMKFPQDSNLSTSRIGNGVWNCLTYWNANHAGVAAPSGCTNPSQKTRYEIYRYEIDNNLLTNLSSTENGAPQCYKGGASTINDSPDRRVLYFAMINCSQNQLNGNRDNVPVAAFGKAFLPEPVASTPGDEIIIEFIDVTRPGADDGVLHEIVQLYR